MEQLDTHETLTMPEVAAAGPPIAQLAPPTPIEARSQPIMVSASLLDEAQQIVEVTIIRSGPAQVSVDGRPVIYSEEALERSVPMWEGAACFCDHFNKSVRNIAGVFFNPRYEDGIRAKLRFIDPAVYRMVACIVKDRDAGLAVPDVGLSADIVVGGEETETGFAVSDVIRVISADIVFCPAAGGSFDRILNSVMQELGIEPGGDEPSAPAEREDPAHMEESSAPAGTAVLQQEDPAHMEESSTPAGTAALQPEDQPKLVPERRVRDLQSSADRLRNQIKEQEADIASLQGHLGEAVGKYRDALLRQHPEIPTTLLTGTTAAELEVSLKAALEVVDNVRKHLSAKVPAGAPARAGLDVAGMSPGDKIMYGLKQRGSRE